jgi:superfamily II DNA/RNA helicase
MPYKKPSNKNFVPRDSASRAGRPKAGSRSPGHRGYRQPDENAPRKQRWNADERAARAAERAGGAPNDDRRAGRAPGERRYGDRDDNRSGSRFSAATGRGDRPYRDGASRSADRGGFDRRQDRPGTDRRDRWQDSSADRRGSDSGDGGYRRAGRPDASGSRPERGRADRGGRPDQRSGAGRDDYSRNARFDGRDDRRGGERYQSDSRYDRRDDRPAGDRFSRDRSDRFERDGRDSRPREDRHDSGSRYDRDARSDRGRPERRDDRPRGDRFGTARDDRPRGDRFDRDSRPARRDYGPRADRGHEGYSRPEGSDRPQRAEGAERRYGSQDRDARTSSFYPDRAARSDTAPFAPQEDVVLERLQAQATIAEDVDGVTFGDLGLGANIVRVLEELGAAAPFPIQAATIPDVIAGRDVLGRGRTGSGKTIAFGAPLVEKLMENNGGRKRSPGRLPRALILAPTRELALQIDRTVQPIARSVGLFTTQIYGGVPQQRQVMALQRGVDIVIGTPGRIEDLISQGRLDLSEVVVTVLDEADHMCDLGFLEPVQRILRLTAPQGQKLLFSATLDSGVAQLVDEFLREPAVHEVAGEDQASSTIDHRVFIVDHRDKTAVIENLASRDGKTLIFSRTRAYAEQLADMLEDAGIRSTSLHGDLNQSRRTRNLGLLTSGRVNVLVATDVAARGIHVDDIDLVIQADAPDEYKTYLHRSGRTGRAGKQGTVVTLIPKQRRRRMDDLLSRAEISAEFTPVGAGEDALSAL